MWPPLCLSGLRFFLETIVCQRIRESYPKIRIILSSTFPLPENHQCSLDAHNVSFLQKPFETATLINLVRDLMDLKTVSPS